VEVGHGAGAAGAGPVRRVGELRGGGAGAVGLVPPQLPRQKQATCAPQGWGRHHSCHWMLHSAMAYRELLAAATVQG
jgi:hypothetical protein